MASILEHTAYTKEQMDKYYDRINLREALRLYTISEASPKASLSYLALLQRHHLTNVPFENLSLHYSPSRHISLHPEVIFGKVVEGNGRGGYCMELNAVFGVLLTSLGYEIYPTGARVHDGKEFGGWSHQVHIVTVGDNRYLVDVGFGASYCPIQPLRLIHDAAGCENIAPSFVRLVWKAIEGNANPYQKLWCYQHRINSDSDFQDMYCFTETEFRFRDFEVMNHFTSTSPRSFFTQRIVCSKMISGGEKGEDVVGVLILQQDVKRRIGVETTQVEVLNTERERVKALQDHFGITLNSIEQDAIKGTMAEIV